MGKSRILSQNSLIIIFIILIKQNVAVWPPPNYNGYQKLQIGGKYAGDRYNYEDGSIWELNLLENGRIINIDKNGNRREMTMDDYEKEMQIIEKGGIGIGFSLGKTRTGSQSKDHGQEQNLALENALKILVNSDEKKQKKTDMLEQEISREKMKEDKKDSKYIKVNKSIRKKQIGSSLKCDKNYGNSENEQCKNKKDSVKSVQPRESLRKDNEIGQIEIDKTLGKKKQSIDIEEREWKSAKPIITETRSQPLKTIEEKMENKKIFDGETLIRRENEGQILQKFEEKAGSSSKDLAISSDVILINLERCRQEGEWLDSSIIDAYLEIIVFNRRPQLNFIPNYIIDMYFDNINAHHEEVINWIIKNISWVEIQLLLVPVYLFPNHWALAVYKANEQIFYIYNSKTEENEVEKRKSLIDFLLIMGGLLQLIQDSQLNNAIMRKENQVTEALYLPQQTNDSDCGVFMLMFASHIAKEMKIIEDFDHMDMNASEFREKIYSEIHDIKFGKSTAAITNLKQERVTTSSNIRGQEMGKSRGKRFRSIHKDKELIREPDDPETIMVKNWYYATIFAKDYNESIHMHGNVAIALFHFKKLAIYMLEEFKRRHMTNTISEFRKEIDANISEFWELIKFKGENIEPFLCIFFKFFMRLRMNRILVNNEEWNKYARFRMRHFYWIYPENANHLTQKLIMEQKYCNNEEIIQVSQNVANVRPYSSISHWWTLKWLLQNSPEFIEKLDEYEGNSLLEMKKRIFELLGTNGFERLEMAIPVLKFYDQIPEMNRINLKRYFSGGLEGTKYELRLGLNFFLCSFVEFRANLSRVKDKMLLLYILDKIYDQIINVKFAQLIDVEHTLEEEVNELKEAVCILLKFFEMKESIPIILGKEIYAISYEQAMQCTADEFENLLERQRFMLRFHHYNSIKNQLSAGDGDKELQNILKSKHGSYYQLKELISFDKILALWLDNTYREKMGDKQYSTLSRIRKPFEFFMTITDVNIVQLNKTKLKIYVIVRWLVLTLQTDPSFNRLWLIWDLMFRLFLDQLTVHPNSVNEVEIECTIRGGKINEFVQKWIGKGRNKNQHLKEFNKLVQVEISKLITQYTERNEVPPLMDGFQSIFVLTLHELANEDKTKKYMEKAKGINLWQFFEDLHNYPDRIARIGELLNINSLKLLYDRLGIKFDAKKFSQLGELSVPIVDWETEENPLSKTKQKSPIFGGSNQEGGLSKSKKKKLKKNKSKTNITSNDEANKFLQEETLGQTGKNAGSEQKIDVEQTIRMNSRKENEIPEKPLPKEEESGGIEKEIPGQKINKAIKLKIFKEYEFSDLMKFDTLNKEYEKLLKDLNNQEQHRLMDITVFAFEIGQRLNALKKFDQNEIKEFKLNEFDDIDKLEESLYILLKKIEIAMKNPIKMGKSEMIDKMEIMEMRKQLHKLRLTWIYQKYPNWQKIINDNKNHIIFALNLCTIQEFDERIKMWKTILEQIEFDKRLYNDRGIQNKIEQSQKDIDQSKFFNFAEYSQQLWFDGQKKEDDILTENHSTAEILFTGSYLLGTMTSRSDMDTIVVTYDLEIDYFNQQAECIIKENGFDDQNKMKRERICKNDKLFICKLCKMDRVILAVEIKGYLRLIKAFICEDDDYEFKSFNVCKFKIKVDFLFAPTSQLKKEEMESLNKKEITSDEIDKILVKIFALSDTKLSFFALLGFRDNIRILEQFPNDAKQFRIACAALKLWAKHNNIYGAKLGFLKGVHMNLLMTKIYLRFPSASTPFLIEKFFATYIVWPWPMPVQLLPISEELTNTRSENGTKLWYNQDPNAVMPIISPGFLESNKASDVDSITKSIMRTFMGEGLKQIQEIREGKTDVDKKWHEFMRGHDLAEKYKHFLIITCLSKAEVKTFGDDFCDIVSLKLHDHVPKYIGELLPTVRWYHIMEAGTRKECLINREGYDDIRKHKCDIWLVGLQPKKDKQIIPSEIIKIEKSMNNESEKMYEEYFDFKKRSNPNLGDLEEKSMTKKLLLTISYADLQELKYWNIQLQRWKIFVK